MDKVDVKIKDKEDRAKVLDTYLNDLKASKMKLTEFDNVLFAMLVDKIIVHKDKTLEMVWKGNA